MEVLELRLLRCFLGGPREPGAESKAEVSSEGIASRGPDEQGIGNVAEFLEDGIRDVLCQIEGGFYSKALASRWWSVLLGDPSSYNPAIGTEQNAAKGFYSVLELRIASFLGVDRGGEGRADLVDEEERQQREVLILALGVGVLCTFLQANMTGPVQDQVPLFPMTAAYSLDEASVGLRGEEWEDWARDQLMVDGCEILGKISLPQYLILAKLLLVNPAEISAKRDGSESRGGPRTRSWWAFRVLLLQQRILAERSATLRSLLVGASLGMVSWFGTSEAVNRLNWNLESSEAQCVVAAAHLEIGLMEHVYGHDDAARECFDRAAKSCGLELSLTGVLGFRTQYQTDPKAQMVLVTSSQSAAENETDWLDFVDDPAEPEFTAAKTEGSEILLTPKLAHANAADANSVEYESLPGGNHKVLNSIEQAIVLAMGVDVKKSNPDDELRNGAIYRGSRQPTPITCYGESLVPTLAYKMGEDPISHPRTLLSDDGAIVLVDIVECMHLSTGALDFSFLNKQASDIREGAVKVSQRMSYVLCVPFPILPALLKEYADMMVGFGLVGDAMKLYEELELWNNLIDCYCLLGKKTAAAALIRERLNLRPDEPRLWCSLGDVTMDEECYHKAWEVSGQHFTRAQRSLAVLAYNKGNFSQAIEHWDIALSLNPLHPAGWFALGSAALKTCDLDKALLAFTRQVQLDPENGESWNNIAAINMQKKRSKEAFVAFREALKLKRNSWQIWENFGKVALDIDNFGQAVLAAEKVFDLSEEKRVDVTALTCVMKELEFRKGITVRPAEGPVRETDGSDELEQQGYSDDDGPESWPSLLMARPSLPKSTDGENLSLAQDRGSFSVEYAASTRSESKDTEMLVEKVGKLLSRVVAKGAGGGKVWGLKARWHRLIGDMSMCIEALLKQIRAYQGSKWQSSAEEFRIFASACLQLSEAYMEAGSAVCGKRELFSAQMLLRSTIKQAEQFQGEPQYGDLVLCLQKVVTELKALCSRLA